MSRFYRRAPFCDDKVSCNLTYYGGNSPDAGQGNSHPTAEREWMAEELIRPTVHNANCFERRPARTNYETRTFCHKYPKSSQQGALTKQSGLIEDETTVLYAGDLWILFVHDGKQQVSTHLSKRKSVNIPSRPPTPSHGTKNLRIKENPLHLQNK
jgi:hypothetical protein